MDEKNIVFKPEDYADLVIKNIETAHLARKNDFLGVASYRDHIVEQFKNAQERTYRAGLRIGRMKAEEERLAALVSEAPVAE